MKSVEPRRLSKPKRATRQRHKWQLKVAPPLSKFEIFAIARDAFKNDAAFATAKDSLQKQMVARGGDGTLRDVQVSLCADGVTVHLFAAWETDEPATASFKLAKSTSEANFDSGLYCFLLEQAQAIKR